MADPVCGDLSKSIVEKLSDITERYRNIDDWEISEQTHEFKEWADHFKGSAPPIPWPDILHAQERSEMVAIVERDEAAREVFEDVFGPES